jgi:TPR repeat protein
MTTLPGGGAAARFALKIAQCLGTAAILLYSAASIAGAEDDYKAGLSLYQRGDVVTAIAKLRPGANAGHAASQALLADILEGAGITDEAITWYRKAAAAGHLEATFALGAFLATGHGVARDEAHARELVTRAAQGGHKGALNYVAQATMSGTLGFARLSADDRSGLSWVRQSAANGYLPALDFLANAYRTGALGEIDVKQAEVLEKQAEQIRFAGRKRTTKKK